MAAARHGSAGGIQSHARLPAEKHAFHRSVRQSRVPAGKLDRSTIASSDRIGATVKGPVERTRYEIWVDRAPDEVLSALVDFGPDRPRIWRETSHPDVYRVHRVGDTAADVTEGVPFAWSREHYEWSEPGVVTLTQLDSNVARDGRIRYSVIADRGGTRITCDRYRAFHGLRGRIAGTLMVVLGRAILPSQLRAGLSRLLPGAAQR